MEIARAADFAGLLAWRQSLTMNFAQQAGGLPAVPSLQWLTRKMSALQSRGGDGVAPSSRARSPRLVWRGKARCGLRKIGRLRLPGWG
jgi:hypothetical protein